MPGLSHVGQPFANLDIRVWWASDRVADKGAYPRLQKLAPGMWNLASNNKNVYLHFLREMHCFFILFVFPFALSFFIFLFLLTILSLIHNYSACLAGKPEVDFFLQAQSTERKLPSYKHFYLN